MRTYYLLLSYLILSINSLQCGEENIPHCLECGSGSESNSCKKCEVKYFPLMDNVLCLPCDDSVYGQEGCGGECINNITFYSNYWQIGEFSCKSSCKEGYYNEANACRPCSAYESYCEKCKYESSSHFTCTSCISNQYQLTNNHCSECYSFYCDQCHFEEESTICDKCSSHYYLKDNICNKCNWILQSEGRVCEVCSEDLTKINSEDCYCTTHYTEGEPEKCVKCPDNCLNCGYNSDNKKTKCFICDEGYTLNSKGNCVSCGDNCNYCYLNADESPICLVCKIGFNLNDNSNCLECGNDCESCIKSKGNTIQCTKCKNNYGLNSQNKCENCPSNCNNCFWKKDKNEFGCSKCANGYIIGEDDKCVSCQTIQEIGGKGCADCYYDKSSPGNNNKYKCKKCSISNSLISIDYAYIENEYKCIQNENSEINNLNGCIDAIYNSSKSIYECNACTLSFSRYTYIINEKKCLKQNEIDLNYCSEAVNKGTEDNPKYSCTKCNNDELILVSDAKDVNNLYHCKSIPDNRYKYCITATKTNTEKYHCLQCKHNLNIYSDESSVALCPESCKIDSYLIYDECYECSSILYGNPGCLSEKGCNYDTNYNKLICNQCREGYFNYSQTCTPCPMKNKGCKKCSQSDSGIFICDECFDGYNLNSTTKLCELIKCKEYPEITPGCVICDDKLNDYKPKSKCQSCKEGYFKTKDESCIFCKSDSYGGHGCEQCSHSEDDKIKCLYCPKGSVFDYYGVCQICEEKIEGCAECKYIKNKKDNNREKLVCTKCKSQYFLTSEGYCIYPGYYYDDISNCNTIYSVLFNRNEKDTSGVDIINNEYTIKEDKFEIYPNCEECEKGYYNSRLECSKINYDKCIFSSIYSNNSLNSICKVLCSDSNNYAMIIYDIYELEYLTIRDKKDIMEIRKQADKDDLYNIINNRYSYTKENLMRSLNMNAPMCIGNLGTGDKNNPVNLRKCLEAKYNPMENNYECIQCLDGYLLNNETKLCIQKSKLVIIDQPGLDCYYENIGTDSKPIYSCVKCFNENYNLFTTDTGAKICLYPSDSCTEAVIYTNYIRNKFNCTNCSSYYIPYESNYYKRKICQSVNSKIQRISDFNITEFSKDKESVEAKNGICENKKLFTPDGKNCFLCSSKMRGCKGSCTFSLNRENPVECEENGCKTGYIETSKGVCESCNSVSSGCSKCHYEDEYPLDYKGFKRKRRFVCDQCKEGNLLSSDGYCYSCYDLGLYNCEKCGFDEKNNNEITCLQCYNGLFLGEDGQCTSCENNTIRVNGNKCVSCDKKEYGGIEGCSMCISDNNIITQCEFCKKGFIFLKNNNTCVKTSENNIIEKYPNCVMLSGDSNSLKCSLCEPFNYVLLNDKCVSVNSIPSHNSHFNEYCQTFITMGKEENLKYSCDKCLDEKYSSYGYLTKFTFESNRTSFCVSYFEYFYYLYDLYGFSYDLGLCEEATISEEENGKIIISCDTCSEGDILSYNSKSNSYYCVPGSSSSECSVNNCQTCKKDNNQVCEKCINNYEINSISGFCVEKTEKIPSVIFKDVYGLEMNQGNYLNGKEVHGPSLILRGVTNSQINAYHSFSFTLSVNLTRSYIKGQVKEVPMICIFTGDGVDESEDTPNMVEYYCMGNLTSSENYNLNELASNDRVIAELKDDDNKNLGIIMPTNLNEISFANIKDDKPKFTIKNSLRTLIFTPNAINNQTSDNYIFDFTLKGTISGDVDKMNLDINIPLVQVEKKAKCNLNMVEDKTAELKCTIDLQEYKEYNTFSFQNIEYENEYGTIELSQISKIYLLNNKGEGNDDGENGDNIEIGGKEGKKKIKTLYIILMGAGGGLIIIIIIIIIACKRKKPPSINMNPSNQFNNQYNNQFNNKFNTNNKAIKPEKIVSKIKKNNIRNHKQKGKNIGKKKSTINFKKKTKKDEVKPKDSSKRKIIPFGKKKNKK